MRRGTTLPELMVACALAALVLTGLSVVLVQGAAWQRSLVTGTELQESNLVALAVLSQAIGEGNAASLRAEPEGLLLGSPRTAGGQLVTDSEGRLLWHRWVIFYVKLADDGVPVLCREAEDFPPLDSPPVLAVDRTVASMRTVERPVTVVARYVSELEVSGTSPVRVRVVSSRTVAGETYRIESVTDVLPRF